MKLRLPTQCLFCCAYFAALLWTPPAWILPWHVLWKEAHIDNRNKCSLTGHNYLQQSMSLQSPAPSAPEVTALPFFKSLHRYRPVKKRLMLRSCLIYFPPWQRLINGHTEPLLLICPRSPCRGAWERRRFQIKLGVTALSLASFEACTMLFRWQGNRRIRESGREYLSPKAPSVLHSHFLETGGTLCWTLWPYEWDST